MEDKKAIKRYSWSLIAMNFTFGFPYFLLSIVLSDIIDEFRLVGSDQGIMKTMTSIGALVALLSVFFLQNKIKKPHMLIIAGIFMTIALALIGCAELFIYLLIYFIILGIGIGYMDATANSFIIDLSRESGTSYLGIMHGMFGIGSLLVPVITKWLLTMVNWRITHVIFACIMLIAVLQLIYFGRKSGIHTCLPPASKMKFDKKEMIGLITDRFMLLLMLSMMFFAFMQTSISLWIVRYVSVTLEKPDLGIWAFSLFWGFASASRLLYSKIKLSPYSIYIWGSLISGIVLLASVAMQNGVLICIACGLFGIFGGPAIPSLIIIGSENQENTSIRTSMLLIMIYVASTIIPIIMGAVAGITSLQVSMFLPGVSGIVAGILVIAAKKIKKPIIITKYLQNEL